MSILPASRTFFQALPTPSSAVLRALLADFEHYQVELGGLLSEELQTAVRGLQLNVDGVYDQSPAGHSTAAALFAQLYINYISCSAVADPSFQAKPQTMLLSTLEPKSRCSSKCCSRPIATVCSSLRARLWLA